MPPAIQLKPHYNHPLDKLIDVMKALRDKEHGCPWDIEQDFKSIAPYTIEEAYEVAEAISNNDMENLREELGDLLLQSIYHAQMASEQDSFDIYDVIDGITEKMIQRHPHVFSSTKARTASDVNAIWDQQKEKEKQSEQQHSILANIPKALPAALRAQKLQKKAAKIGFEWRRTEHVLDKLHEELEELENAKTHAEKLEEYGDLLFVMVNYGRMAGLNAEEALRLCNQKFENRFKGIEDDFKAKNQNIQNATLEELLNAWEEQKKKE